MPADIVRGRPSRAPSERLRATIASVTPSGARTATEACSNSRSARSSPSDESRTSTSSACCGPFNHETHSDRGASQRMIRPCAVPSRLNVPPRRRSPIGSMNHTRRWPGSVIADQSLSTVVGYARLRRAVRASPAAMSFRPILRLLVSLLRRREARASVPIIRSAPPAATTRLLRVCALGRDGIPTRPRDRGTV